VQDPGATGDTVLPATVHAPEAATTSGCIEVVSANTVKVPSAPCHGDGAAIDTACG
jgi:hypothetical protein